MLKQEQKIKITCFSVSGQLYIRLNVTFGNEDGNCIDGDIWEVDVDGGEFFVDKGLLSIRLYGFILQSV